MINATITLGCYKKYKYDTLDNLPGEVLTDIRALADQFLIAFPNINTTIGQSFRCL
jgi:hypothetical protein